MYHSHRVAISAASKRARHLCFGILAFGVAALLQGCSASREVADDASRLGHDPSSGRMAAPPREEWRQPTSFDNNGPAPVARQVYRGGRDPATGRAQQDWAQAALPQSQHASITPLPPVQPAPAPYGAMPPPPTASAPMAMAGAAGGTSVEVKPGDTLYRIARANNVTVPRLMQANGLTNESIKVGQRLAVPAR